jgi:hypothetical protein
MGGCSINLVDEQSALYNPGALGLFHMNKVFAYSAPYRAKWLPELDSETYTGTYGASAGVSYNKAMKSDSKYNFSLGLAYFKQKLYYGEIELLDSFGAFEGFYYPIDQADFYSAGIGAEYYLRLGIGITHKKIKSDLDPEAGTVEVNATDFGVIAELPVMDFFDSDIYLDAEKAYPITLDFTPSIAYVAANFGDSIVYRDAANASPLPQIKKVGLSLYSGINIKNVSFLSGRLAWERQRWCIGAPNHIFKYGTEITLFDILSLRNGRYKDEDGRVVYYTRGFGFNLGGVVSWLRLASRLETDNDYLQYLIDHIDITYDYAEYGFTKDESPVAGTQFLKLCVSF